VSCCIGYRVIFPAGLGFFEKLSSILPFWLAWPALVGMPSENHQKSARIRAS